MITLKPDQKTIRETKAPFEYDKDGEIVTADIRVRYYTATTKELKESYAEAVAAVKAAQDNNETAVFWHSDKLIKRLAALPDLVDEDGQEFPITIEFLESIDVRNLAAMVKAIEDDENPKSTAPVSA